MPKKVPLVSIGVSRDGVTVNPPVGKAFDFTVDELRDLDKMSSTTLVDYYRDTLNEDATQNSAAGDSRAAQAALISTLIKDTSNMDTNGNLKMGILNDALKDASLPKMSAAERDSAVADLQEM